MDHSQAVALTYVEAYTLRRNDLDDVLAEYPAPAARVHRAARRVLMQRAMLRYLAQQSGKPGPRSVVFNSASHGYVTVHEVLSSEQKVDQVFDLIVNNKLKQSAVTDPDTAQSPSSAPDPNPPSATITRVAPRPEDGDMRKQVADLSGQVQQLVASQAALTDLVKSMAAHMQSMQPAQ